jgi:putative ATPase
MIPLAEKLRPTTIEGYMGQETLIAKNAPIRKMLENRKIFSMILWGPPGCGKTTLAKVVANYVDAKFISFSAVTGSKADVMRIIEEARANKQFYQKDTILFVDEIHRFNKAQQDAFLPFVEDGTVALIGATTENPSFQIIAPLLSRCKVFKLEQLSYDDLKTIATKVILEFPTWKIDEEALDFLILNSNGDARFLINSLELVFSLAKKVTVKVAQKALQNKHIYYDKKGDNHYDTISAFIKSMRGSEVDATLHYLARMIKAGEDPLFIARRMVIFASEDIGNIRPNALVLATSCMQAVSQIGMPESQLILAQTAVYLAQCPKSIASSTGLFAALSDVENLPLDMIPLHLRNASSKLMKELGYAKGHVRYPWQEERITGKKIKQQYLPDNIKDRKYYEQDW